MFGTRLVSKCRTPKASRSLSPSFHHIATFDPAATVAGYDALQVIVWADYGPLDNKVFMGVAQVQVNFGFPFLVIIYFSAEFARLFKRRNFWLVSTFPQFFNSKPHTIRSEIGYEKSVFQSKTSFTSYDHL